MALALGFLPLVLRIGRDEPALLGFGDVSLLQLAEGPSAFDAGETERLGVLEVVELAERGLGERLALFVRAARDLLGPIVEVPEVAGFQFAFESVGQLFFSFLVDETAEALHTRVTFLAEGVVVRHLTGVMPAPWARTERDYRCELRRGPLCPP